MYSKIDTSLYGAICIKAASEYLNARARYAKAVADIILGIPVDLRDWYLLHKELDPHPLLIPFLATAVIEQAIPKSLAKETFCSHIKRLMAMKKHGKLEGDAQCQGQQVTHLTQ